MKTVSPEPDWVYPATTDIRLSAEEKWCLWKIFMPGSFPFLGMTASPLVRFQSTAVRVAFSSGSPTRPSSSCASEWQVASTWMHSLGASVIWMTPLSPLKFQKLNQLFWRVVALTYGRPATPSTTKLSLVSVPVLSKQQISTFPAKGILKGSVQKTAKI